MTKPRTYYEILAVSPSASAIEIKKAYRKLALQFHPDRNPGSRNAEATKRFQEIGEAFECLSDHSSRAEYDVMLRQGSGPSSASPFAASTTFRQPHRRHVDPFTQFDHLFRNDPFFQEAFKEMDEEFSKRFQNSNNNTNNEKNSRPVATSQKKSVEGWVPWLFRQCGVDFQMTTVVTDGSGRMSASRYSSTNRGSYTAKETKSYVDSQGRRVVVHSMEQNGNQIQDTVINKQLVERKVNGVAEKLELIKNTKHESIDE